MSITIQEYITAHQAKQPTADVVSRWESRVVPNGLHLRGRDGAESYLARWGKGIRQDKLLALFAIARAKQCDEMASRFVEEAFFLETGRRERATPSSAAAPLPAARARPLRDAFGAEPQLPSPITPAQAASLLGHSEWGVQEKHDGTRALFKVEIVDGETVVDAGNKLGLCRAVPLPITDALRLLPPCELDGEVVGTRVYLFDLLSLRDRDLRELGCEQRHEMLAQLFVDTVESHPEVIEAVTVTRFVYGDEDAKREFASELEARRAEGFILKKLDAPYVPGDSDTQLKCQFRRSAAVIAGEKNPGKNSIEVFVYRSDGSRRSLGSLTIKASQTVPAPGTVLEVKYLYVHTGPAGKFAQPEFLNVRDDVDPKDCTDDKLQIKAAA